MADGFGPVARQANDRKLLRSGPKVRFGDMMALEEAEMSIEISRLKRNRDLTGLALMTVQGGKKRIEMAVKALEDLNAVQSLCKMGTTCGYASVLAVCSLDNILKKKDIGPTTKDMVIRALSAIKECGCPDNRKMADQILIRFGKSLKEKL